MTVEIDPKKVEKLAAQGLTTKQIADCLGIARSTLYKHKDKSKDISDALKRGRSKGIATVANALFEAALDGNITAQIFYLKNRAPEEWRDKHEHVHASRQLLVSLTGTHDLRGSLIDGEAHEAG